MSRNKHMPSLPMKHLSNDLYTVISTSCFIRIKLSSLTMCKGTGSALSSSGVIVGLMLSIVLLDAVRDDAPEMPVLRTVMPPKRTKRNAGFKRGSDRSIIDDASGNVAMATQADRITRRSRCIMVHYERRKNLDVTAYSNSSDFQHSNTLIHGGISKFGCGSKLRYLKSNSVSLRLKCLPNTPSWPSRKTVERS